MALCAADPEGEGPFPLVLWLHLRGSKCFGSAGLFEAVWPCGPAAIPRYDMGYDYLLHALAERGYAVVAPNLTGAFSEAPSWAPPDAPQTAGSMDFYRVEPLIDRLLAELAAANRGESLAFGQDLAGKLDLGQLLFAGHSRGGEWANLLALRRAGNDAPEEIAAGRGPARGLFLLTPAHGDFAQLDPDTLRTADLPFAVVPAYCDGDLKENPLLGQAYLEQALLDEQRRAPAWVAALKTGEQMCVVDQTVELRPNAPPEDWAFHQPKFAGYPPQLRVQWDAPDGRLSLAIPAEQGDLSGYATLHLRTLVDMFDPRNAGLDSQALRVALVDAAGNEASVVLPPSEPALLRDRGERNSLWQWAQFPLRARSVRIPLSTFAGVDLASIRSLDFVFDQTAQGSLLLSMVEFVADGG